MLSLLLRGMSYKALEEHFRRPVGVYGVGILLERLTSSELPHRPDPVVQMLFMFLLWKTDTPRQSSKSCFKVPCLHLIKVLLQNSRKMLTTFALWPSQGLLNLIVHRMNHQLAWWKGRCLGPHPPKFETWVGAWNLPRWFWCRWDHTWMSTALPCYWQLNSCHVLG